jgi:DNA-directed RNA polymerase specialized sigma24 family protein
MNERDSASEFNTVPDHVLAGRVRDGDRLAYGILYRRHRTAAWGMACVVTGFCPDAEIALIEGFARACAALPESLGPGFDLRGHLLAGVRRAATDRLGQATRRAGPDPASDPPGPAPAVDAAALSVADNPVRSALRLLPEDWRTALWLTDVEGMTPAEVSAIVGLDPAEVIPLRSVTWRMVRAAWLEGQLRIEAPARCRPAVDRLGRYSRGELSAREQILVKGHFSTCADCATRRRQLADPRVRLVDALLPMPDLGLETAARWRTLTGLRAETEAEAQPESADVRAGVVGTESVQRIWLDPLAASTPAARRFAAWVLASWGFTEMLDVVQLLTSELVTSAVTQTHSPLQLVLDRRPGAVRVEVRDAPTTHPSSTLFPHEADPGHGLLLLEALADAWGVTDQGAGKVVWFELAAQDVAHPEPRARATQTADPDRQPVGARS